MSVSKKKKSITQNYFFAILALSFLLYLLGSFGTLLIYGNKAMMYAKEQVPFFIELKDSIDNSEINSLMKELNKNPFIKEGTVQFISKDLAMEKLIDKNLTREDILIFGDNILPNSIEFNLKNQFLNQSKTITYNLKKNPIISTVTHTEEIINNFNWDLQRIAAIAILILLFFIFVANTLIQNSLKLSLLSNKKTIKVLQMAGATKSYISRPYILKSILYGFLSSFISISALVLTIYGINQQLKHLSIFEDWLYLSILFSVLVLLGIILFWTAAIRCLRTYFKIYTI
jgi:cell division transport system permease protein